MNSWNTHCTQSVWLQEKTNDILYAVEVIAARSIIMI